MTTARRDPSGYPRPWWAIRPAITFFQVEGETYGVYTIGCLARAINRHDQWIRAKERSGELPYAFRMPYRVAGNEVHAYSERAIWKACGLAASHGLHEGRNASPQFVEQLRRTLAQYALRRPTTASVK